LGKNTGEVWQREKQGEKKKDNDMEGETEKPEHRILAKHSIFDDCLHG